MNKFLLLALTILSLAVTSTSVGATALVANPQEGQGAQVVQAAFIIVRHPHRNHYQLVYDPVTGQYYYVPARVYHPYRYYEPDNGIVLNFGFGGHGGHHGGWHRGWHHHH